VKGFGAYEKRKNLTYLAKNIKTSKNNMVLLQTGANKAALQFHSFQILETQTKLAV